MFPIMYKGEGKTLLFEPTWEYCDAGDRIAGITSVINGLAALCFVLYEIQKISSYKISKRNRLVSAVLIIPLGFLLNLYYAVRNFEIWRADEIPFSFVHEAIATAAFALPVLIRTIDCCWCSTREEFWEAIGAKSKPKEILITEMFSNILNDRNDHKKIISIIDDASSSYGIIGKSEGKEKVDLSDMAENLKKEFGLKQRPTINGIAVILSGRKRLAKEKLLIEWNTQTKKILDEQVLVGIELSNQKAYDEAITKLEIAATKYEAIKKDFKKYLPDQNVNIENTKELLIEYDLQNNTEIDIAETLEIASKYLPDQNRNVENLKELLRGHDLQNDTEINIDEMIDKVKAMVEKCEDKSQKAKKEDGLSQEVNPFVFAAKRLETVQQFSDASLQYKEALKVLEVEQNDDTLMINIPKLQQEALPIKQAIKVLKENIQRCTKEDLNSQLPKIEEQRMEEKGETPNSGSIIQVRRSIFENLKNERSEQFQENIKLKEQAGEMGEKFIRLGKNKSLLRRDVKKLSDFKAKMEASLAKHRKAAQFHLEGLGKAEGDKNFEEIAAQSKAALEEFKKIQKDFRNENDKEHISNLRKLCDATNKKIKKAKRGLQLANKNYALLDTEYEKIDTQTMTKEEIQTILRNTKTYLAKTKKHLKNAESVYPKKSSKLSVKLNKISYQISEMQLKANSDYQNANKIYEELYPKETKDPNESEKKIIELVDISQKLVKLKYLKNLYENSRVRSENLELNVDGRIRDLAERIEWLENSAPKREKMEEHIKTFKELDAKLKNQLSEIDSEINNSRESCYIPDLEGNIDKYINAVNTIVEMLKNPALEELNDETIDSTKLNEQKVKLIKQLEKEEEKLKKFNAAVEELENTSKQMESLQDSEKTLTSLHDFKLFFNKFLMQAGKIKKMNTRADNSKNKKRAALFGEWFNKEKQEVLKIKEKEIAEEFEKKANIFGAVLKQTFPQNDEEIITWLETQNNDLQKCKLSQKLIGEIGMFNELSEEPINTEEINEFMTNIGKLNFVIEETLKAQKSYKAAKDSESKEKYEEADTTFSGLLNIAREAPKSDFQKEMCEKIAEQKGKITLFLEQQ